MTRHVINTTGLCKEDLPADLTSFVTTQLPKIEELEQVEKRWLATANEMSIQELNVLVDEMWSGWVRAKLCEILAQRS
jgi:hypothetical protein